MSYKNTKEWKEKMSNSMIGKKHSKETKNKISHRGRSAAKLKEFLLLNNNKQGQVSMSKR